MVFFLENVFPSFFWGKFWQKSEKNLKLKKLEDMMKKHNLLKENVFILLRGISNIFGERKISWR